MPRIAFVGAGSAVFTRNLVGDILSLPELRDDVEIALMDIDAERLSTAELITSRLIEAHGARATVEATTDLGNPNGWVNLGPVSANGAGLMSFIDTDGTNYPTRFYRFVNTTNLNIQ